ncbi:MAG: caspase family protein, partial [Polyangiales bacterium]
MAVWLGGLGSPGVSAQQLAGGDNYALLVGSNEGGPGQATLRYAEADTEKVAEVLTTLGGYPAAHVERLLHPTAAQLRDALTHMRERVAQPARGGVPSRFFFYYSGHARADALNLGGETVPLPELRRHLETLPATLSIVVLDACQSGAFSRPKGAAPATDFSFNSVERLNTAGLAVIASSNEGELSQESDLLRSSYFTHHWLVGLRGAGDHNRDGRVSLSEAYQYAYNHTLATTAETAVGEQHATLETNLRGQDEVALTQPAAARARLKVPAGFSGRILLQALPSWSVLAELDKVSGDSVTLALPQGDYAATLRRGDTAARCALRLRDGAELLL